MNTNWFEDLFIDEAKAALENRGNSSGDSSGGVEINNQDKTITENGTYTADAGYTGLGIVEVNVPTGGGADDGSFKGVIERTATNVTLPSDLTKIGDYAFYQCKKLALTSLPDGITSIGNQAFNGCDKLALTSLPDGLTEIGFYAFSNCPKLAVTSLPASLLTIGNHAFKSCTGLTEITFEGTPDSIVSTSFSSCYNLLTINVPWAEGEVANAPWGATKATINYNYTGG